MTALRRGVLLLALLIAFAFPAAGEITDAQRQEADAFFSALFEESRAVGGVVLVAQQGAHLYDFSYGYADRRHTRAVAPDTVFKAASVTKLVTAIGMLRLVEQGLIALDEPLAQATGQSIINPLYPEAAITLRQVMSHTSSIASTASYSRAVPWETIPRSSDYFLSSAPGTVYEYANLNGGLLGSLIERLSGQSLNSFMRQQVFEPLGINAAYAAPLLPDPSALSATFKADGSLYISAESYLEDDAAYEDSCNPDAHYRAAVGGLYISASGLETLGMALAGGGQASGVQLLSPEMARMMQLDQSLVAGSSVTAESPYGLCLYRLNLDGDVWYGHQGRWEGLVVDLFFERETETVVVLVANGVRRKLGLEICPQGGAAIRFVQPWTYFIVD